MKKITHQTLSFKHQLNTELVKKLALYGFGFIVALLGLLVITGWYTHTSSLVQITPSIVPMQFNTALAFLLCGLGMLLYVKMPRLSFVCGLLIVLLGSFTLLEYIALINFGLDQFFIKPYIITNTTYPGRMAPNTALYASIAGLIILLRPTFSSFQYLNLIRFALSIFLTLAGVMAIFGYLAQFPTAYSWGNLSQIAPHTALGFVLVGLGFSLFIWYEHRLYTIRKNLFFPLGIVVLGTLSFIFLWQSLVLNEHQKTLKYTQNQAFVIKTTFVQYLNSYFLEIDRMQKQLSVNFYTTTAAWKSDAAIHLHDLSALTALSFIKKTANGLSLETELRDFSKDDDLRTLQQCLQNLKTPSFMSNQKIILITNLQQSYLCITLPIISKDNNSLLASLINIRLLADETIKQIPGIENYSIELSNEKNIIYQRLIPQASYYKHYWSITLPITYKNLQWVVTIWPNDALIKQSETWFPTMGLIAGLFITFLLALAVRMNQMTKEKVKELKSSELEYRMVINSTSDAIIIFNKEGKVILLNRYALNLFGYSEQEILNMTVETLMPERFREKHKVYRHSYMKCPTERSMSAINTLILKTKQGEEIPVEIGLNPITIHNEQNILCSIHDMRTAKSNEYKLLQQTRIMQLILDIMNAITNEKNFETTLQHCLTIICTTFDWPVGHVYLVDEKNKNQLIPSSIWFLKDPEKLANFYQITMDSVLSYGLGLPGRVLASGSPTWIVDVCQDNNFPRAGACSIANLHSAFAFPIKLDGKIISILEFFSYEPRVQDNSFLLTINVLSNQINHFIEYQHIQVQSIKLSNRFKFATASGKMGIWELNLTTNKLFLDEQMFILYGINPATFTGTYDDLVKTIHPDDINKTTEAFNKSIKIQTPFEAEFRIIKPTGDIRYIHANATILLADDGNSKIVFGISRDITKEKLLTDELEKLNTILTHYAYYDSLTGLMNRHAFKDAAKRLLAQAKRHNYTVGVLFVDLDHFKKVNDSFGHEMGDQVLIETTKRVTKILRNEDITCRLGGDEFAVLLNNINSEHDAISIAKKIINEISKPIQIEDHKIHIGASIGIAIFPECGDKISELLNKADAALLQAKNSGRGQFKIYFTDAKN